MTLSTFIAFLAVLFIGVPAALRVTSYKVRIRNPVALGIVVTWVIGQVIYFKTGEYMPVRALFLQDMAVIACMFVKNDWRDCSPYRDWRQQIAALWHERTPWDRGILALFPLAWLFYLPIADQQLQYWTLYGIGMAQLALAGREAFDPWLRAFGQKLRADNERPSGLEFSAWERGYG